MTSQPPAHDLVCHRCGALLTPGEGSFYVVRIDAIADPSPPTIDSNESLADLAADWERLLDNMRDMSEQELMDQVHRRVTIHLCASCYRKWIDDPRQSALGYLGTSLDQRRRREAFLLLWLGAAGNLHVANQGQPR